MFVPRERWFWWVGVCGCGCGCGWVGGWVRATWPGGECGGGGGGDDKLRTSLKSRGKNFEKVDFSIFWRNVREVIKRFGLCA